MVFSPEICCQFSGGRGLRLQTSAASLSFFFFRKEQKTWESRAIFQTSQNNPSSNPVICTNRSIPNAQFFQHKKRSKHNRPQRARKQQWPRVHRGDFRTWSSPSSTSLRPRCRTDFEVLTIPMAFRVLKLLID